jgi:5-methylcytosine-specific restriction endonuclease McrA
MPICRHCKSTGSSDRWNRYAPTKRNPAGILHALCPTCDELAQERQAAVAQAHARGYESVANTPEYRRMQRERESAQQGRSLCGYVSKAERERHALLLRADRAAHRVRRRHFKALLLEWNRIVLTRPDVVEELREENAAKSREYYHRNLQRSRRKTAMYKVAHPEWAIEHQEIRMDRIKAMDDGTLTVQVVRELKAQAARCAYCDDLFVLAGEKQTDHMVAICHGGEHSRRNVVIVCRRCNGRKARLTYAEWLDRIEPAHRARAVALFYLRYGAGAVARPDADLGTLVDLVATGATGAPLAATSGA